MRPTEHVLDMFAVPGDVVVLAEGRDQRVRAGDLVLSPGRHAATRDRLSPVLARLAVDLDTRPARHHRDLRLAMPVPARDGSWVVDGWAATRFEPDTRPLTDLTATLAVGAVLHAELAARVTAWPATHEADGGAERFAFGEGPAPAEALPPEGQELLRRLAQARDDTPIGPDRLVHRDLAGGLLLDPSGAPVVVDVVPSWRPALWAEAIWVLDGVTAGHADPEVVHEWSHGPRRQALLRAALTRLAGSRPVDVASLASALAPLLASLPA